MKKIRPGQKIKLTSVEELLGVSNEESAMDIEVVKIHPFRNHPFKVIDDEKMEDLVESIRTNGILSPVLIRPIGNDVYEMVSGHRRMHAAILLGMDRIPAIIREMTDDEAIVKMVDANIQREELLPSEKAFAYKMKMDAMKHQGKATSDQSGPKLTVQRISEGDSASQVKRYIRLTNLIPELLEYMDRGEMALTVGEALSYLSEEMQYAVLDAMEEQGCTPSLSQACRMKKLFSDGQLTEDDVFDILAEEKANQREMVKIPLDVLQLFFPDYTPQQIKNAIVRMLEQQKKPQKRSREEER